MTSGPNSVGKQLRGAAGFVEQVPQRLFDRMEKHIEALDAVDLDPRRADQDEAVDALGMRDRQLRRDPATE